MKKSDIVRMLKRVKDSGYGDWQKEYAIVMYFYPACSALLTDEEWESIIKADELTVKRHKIDFVVQTLGNRLVQIVKSLRLPADSYVSAIIYGMIGGSDFRYTVTEKGELYICKMQEWKPKVKKSKKAA